MDDFFDMDPFELAFALGMAETIADEEIERYRIEREFERDQADDVFYERNDDFHERNVQNLKTSQPTVRRSPSHTATLANNRILLLVLSRQSSKLREPTS